MNKTLPGIAFFIAFSLFACSTPAKKSSTPTPVPSTSKASGKKVVVTPSKPVVQASGAPGLERDILNLINEHRAAKKLPPLTNNPHMEFQARRHSMEMATQRVPFGHQGMSFRMKYIQEKVPGVLNVAENVAYGSLSAKAVVEGWLKSPGHKKNIEGNYKYSGVGVARNQNNQLYFTQLVAK
jgi:uncharacterized protein YkwD